MDRALGIDVSHWHPVKSWDRIPETYRFIGIKVSEGSGNVDPTFAAHRDAVRALGDRFDLVIYYHVARPGSGPEQAARFAGLIGDLAPNERQALDTERTSAVGVDYLQDFLDALARDRRKMLYTSNGVWLGPFMNNPVFPMAKDVDLWLPRYGSASEPVVPDPWAQIGKTWTIWQTSETGNVPGIDGTCDINSFNGGPDSLRTYAALNPPAVA